MNNFELQIWDDTGKACTFYTVLKDGHTVNETDKFFEKIKNKPALLTSLRELALFIEQKIGNEYGAVKEYFREERNAQAIPPPFKIVLTLGEIFTADTPLRLYCLRLSNSLVVLFNGAEKTSQSAQDGDTSMVFYEANIFAKRIIEALNDGLLQIDLNEKQILNHNGGTELYL